MRLQLPHCLDEKAIRWPVSFPPFFYKQGGRQQGETTANKALPATTSEDEATLKQ